MPAGDGLPMAEIYSRQALGVLMAATRPRQIFDQVKPGWRLSASRGSPSPSVLMSWRVPALPPRIVWCKSTGAILPTDRAGGEPSPSCAPPSPCSGPSLGRDDDQAEQLLEETVRGAGPDSRGVPPRRRGLATARQARQQQGRRHCVLTFEVELYVESRPTTKAKIKHVELDTDGAVQGDDVLQAGES